MDKYEYRLKTDHIKQVAANKDYAAAAKLCDTIDWNKVRDVKMLTLVADIYTAVERYQDAIEALIQAYDYAPIGRRIVYRLTELALEADNYEDANDYFDEFCRIAPHDQGRYILLYKMACSQHATVAEKIKILEAYKKADFDEKWAYELAALYARNHQTDKCVQLCDDIILWFGLGKYVEKALELKARYAPLTEEQKAKAQELRNQKDNRQYESRKDQIQEIQGVPDSVKELRVDSELDAVGKVTAAAVRSIENEAAKQEKQAAPVYMTDLNEEEKSSQDAAREQIITGSAKRFSKLISDNKKHSGQEDTEDAVRQMAAELKKAREEFDIQKVKEHAEEPASTPEKEAQTVSRSSGEISYEKEPTKISLYTGAQKGEEKIKTRTDIWTSAALNPATREAIEIAAVSSEEEISLPDGIVTEISSITPIGEQLPVFLDENFEYEIEEEGEPFTYEEGEAIDENEASFSEKEIEDSAPVDEDTYSEDEKDSFTLTREHEESDEDNRFEEYDSEELYEEEPEFEEYQPKEQYAEDIEETGIEVETVDPYEETEVEEEAEEEPEAEEESEPEAEEEAEEELEPEVEEEAEEESEPEDEEEPEEELEPEVEEEAEEEAEPEVEEEAEEELRPEDEEPEGVQVNPQDLSKVWHFVVGLSDKDKALDVVMDYIAAISEKSERPLPERAAKVTGYQLNSKDLLQSFDRLLGKIVIVINAADMEERVVDEFCKVLEPSDRSLLVVLSDTQSRLERMLAKYPRLSEVFTTQFMERHFTGQELLDYAKEYADGQDCVLDEKAEILLLEQLEEVAENTQRDKKRIVELLVNHAIDDAEKKSLKRSFQNLFRVRYDKEGCLILTDRNFQAQ